MGDVVMPRLSDSMEEGTILKWLKAAGDEVRRGDALAEIETDKATMTYEADADGVLEIVAGEGDTLPIGALIARIGGGAGGVEGSNSSDEKGGDQGGAGETQPPADPAPKRDLTPHNQANLHLDGPAAPTAAGDRVAASPVARRIARDLGVDLNTVAGSGPGGRIVKADVELAAARPSAPPPPAPAPRSAPPPPSAPSPPPAPPPPSSPTVAPSPPPAPTAIGPAATATPSPPQTAKGEITIQELSRTQQVIARRMAEAKATIPEFTLSAEIDMQTCFQLRAELKAIDQEGPLPSFNDMIVKACAIALREYPRANGSYRDGHFELHGRVNVGVAVAARDSLVVPTIFDADRKPLGQIARETRALAERVRAATITPPELSGGTFTVSNLGMYAIESFTAVINSPQAAILSVGALAPKAVVRDGELVARHTMSVTLACDHRILYGADAAEFLARIRTLLEHPLALAL